MNEKTFEEFNDKIKDKCKFIIKMGELIQENFKDEFVKDLLEKQFAHSIIVVNLHRMMESETDNNLNITLLNLGCSTMINIFENLDIALKLKECGFEEIYQEFKSISDRFTLEEKMIILEKFKNTLSKGNI